MYKQNLLKAKLIALSMPRSELAGHLGISITTLNYKLNGIQEFKLSEIQKICTILKLSKKERDNIFFA